MGAPPYGVISEDEQDAYYQAHPYNVIRLIIGEKRLQTLMEIKRQHEQRSIARDREDLDYEQLFHCESSMKAAVTRVQSGTCQMELSINPSELVHV